MKHIGIVGVSAEGAALCYRTICAESAPILGPHLHPDITLHTFALGRYMRHMAGSDWKGVADLMLASTRKLADCGADFVVCPDNTAHQAMDLVVSKSPLPWLHIAEEVAEVAVARQFKDVAVLGTRYLMEGPVYPSKSYSRGIRHQIPDTDSLARKVFARRKEFFGCQWDGRLARRVRRASRRPSLGCGCQPALGSAAN